MKRIPKIILSSSLTIVGAVLINVLFASACSGIESMEAGVEGIYIDGQTADLFGANGIFTRICSFLILLIGTLSVIMLIIGGMRFIIATGSASSMADAKNTILYAIVGIVISLTAYTIINFILSSLLSGGSKNL